MLLSVLGLGLLIGMQHALEADHVAAVSSMVSRRTGLESISRHGIFWGIGHTLTLLLVAGTCIALGTTISNDVAAKLEFAVGFMLVALGAHVLWRLWRERVHYGMHSHRDGVIHLHAHSHRDDHVPHARNPHHHQHPEGLPWRTLLVGLMHGMAGSAALVVLTATSLNSPWWGPVYVLVFGLGSIIGMGLLSLAIALPLTYTARTMTVANSVLQCLIGITTIVIGLSVLHETGSGIVAGL